MAPPEGPRAYRAPAMACSLVGKLLRLYGVPVLGAAAGGFVGGVAAALTGGPLAASLSVALGGLIYVAAGALGLPVRLAGLGLALGAHVAALTSYYSSPVPLPFLILELDPGQGRAALGIDIVQLLLAHEAAWLLGEPTECPQEGGAEGLKGQEEFNGETGPGEPLEEAGSGGAGQPR